MSQAAAGPSQAIEYAIVGYNGKPGVVELDHEDMERVDAWFANFQRSKRTYPMLHKGSPTTDYVTRREAWDALNDFSISAHDEDSFIVPLGDPQTLVEITTHRDDLWELTRYTTRGYVGYYGEGFAFALSQNTQMCMDRTYIVLAGKVRYAFKISAFAIYHSASAILKIAYAK